MVGAHLLRTMPFTHLVLAQKRNCGHDSSACSTRQSCGLCAQWLQPYTAPTVCVASDAPHLPPLAASVV